MDFQGNRFIDDKDTGRRSIYLSKDQLEILQHATSFVPECEQPEFLFRLGESLFELEKKQLSDGDVEFCAMGILRQMLIPLPTMLYEAPRKVPPEWESVPQSNAVH